MAAKVITIANQKGGTGKTTVCMQLAGTFSHSGEPTLIIDADKQGTATRWAASAGEDAPFPSRVLSHAEADGPVHRAIVDNTRLYRYIFVDCPPAVESPVTQSALLVSDLVLVPVIPSPADLWSSVGIRELVHRMARTNRRLEARLVANMCQPHTVIAREILGIMSDFGIPLLRTRLHLRTAYRQSALFGSTVRELGRGADSAGQEVQALAHEVLEALS